MSDDKSKAGGQDRSRINTSEDYEVRDWSKKFGVTPDQLKAVAGVNYPGRSTPTILAGALTHQFCYRS